MHHSSYVRPEPGQRPLWKNLLIDLPLAVLRWIFDPENFLMLFSLSLLLGAVIGIGAMVHQKFDPAIRHKIYCDWQQIHPNIPLREEQFWRLKGEHLLPGQNVDNTTIAPIPMPIPVPR